MTLPDVAHQADEPDSDLPEDLLAVHRRLEAAAARLAIAGARDLREVLVQARLQAAETSQAVDLLNQVQLACQNEAEVGQLLAAAARIDQVVQVIGRIASDTNLLALNASIEAARAGQHGRGFAVLAQEIRKLSEGTAREAKQITELVDGVRQRVGRVGELVADSKSQAEAADRQGERGQRAVEQIGDFMTDTAAEIEEIVAANEQLLETVGSVDGRLRQVGERARGTVGRAEAAFGSESVHGATEEIFWLLTRHRYGGTVEQMLALARAG